MLKPSDMRFNIKAYKPDEGSSELLGHGPCPRCRASGKDTKGDNLALYKNADGSQSSFCFVCSYYSRKGDPAMPSVAEVIVPEKSLVEFDTGSYNPSVVKACRSISPQIFQKYAVHVEDDKHIYPYYDRESHLLCGLKYRFVAEKGFSCKGKMGREAPLFGMNLFPKGVYKTCILTEGELDALSAYQMMSGRVPSLSIANGAQAAKRAVQANWDYLSSFETVYLCFDSDEEGRRATEEVAPMFQAGKVKLIQLPGEAKDANDVLDKLADPGIFNRAYNNAKVWVPEGIICSSNLWETLLEDDTKESVPYPWASLNDYTYGIRPGELITLCSGCVDADTEFLTRAGWKRIAEYEVGDEVLQYDKDTKVATFTLPQKYVKLPAKSLWHIKTKYGVDQVLSDEHRILYDTADGYTYVNTLAEVMDIHASQVTGFRGKLRTTFILGDTGSSSPMSDPILRVMTAVIADGHFPSLNNKCKMRLKKERKKERITKLLTEANIPFTREPCSPYEGFEVFTFVAPYRVKEASQELFWSMDARQLKLFTEEVLFWDGCISGNSFSSRNKTTADFVQYAFSANGQRATLLTQVRGDQGIDLSVYMTKKTLVSFRKTNMSKPEFKEYPTTDGFKYCFAVPTGFLVLRRGPNIFITGNSGQGKSAFMKEIAYHLLKNTRANIGLLFLEEGVKKTAKGIMSLELNKPLHIPDTKYSPEEFQKAYNVVMKPGRFYFYDHFGSTSIDNIVAQVHYMAMVAGCRYIFLDHISIIVSSQENGDERKALDEIMTKLRTLVQETGICLFVVTHLKRVDDGHENGGEISLNHLRGSAGIAQLSDFVIGLERNSQDPDVSRRNTTVLRVLKNRPFGISGLAAAVHFDRKTWRLNEVDLESYLTKGKGGAKVEAGPGPAPEGFQPRRPQ